jgi:DNA modification methylase
MTVRIVNADVLAGLAQLPDESVHMCVTSPPYLGLRDYGIPPQEWSAGAGLDCIDHEWGDSLISSAKDSNRGSMNWTTGGDPAAKVLGERVSQGVFCQRCGAWRGSLGLEPTVDLYVEHMVAVFREVRRVLRRDGTLWLNIGDSYASIRTDGMKPKDLIGIPWMLAFALRADGWWLRSEITWAKRAPMPESCTDRPTSATEKVFLLAKSAKYFYDAEAVKEPWEEASVARDRRGYDGTFMGRTRIADPRDRRERGLDGGKADYSGRNQRNFWLLGPEPFPEAHFATFVSEIPRRAILAGTSERGVCPKCAAPWVRVVEKGNLIGPGHENYVLAKSRAAIDDKTNRARSEGWWPNHKLETKTLGWRPTCGCDAGEPVPATVLEPFAGAFTTCLVAEQLRRDSIGIELNPEYCEMGRRRLATDAPLFFAEAAQ